MLNRGEPPFLRLRPSSTPSAAATWGRVFEIITPKDKPAQIPFAIVTDRGRETEIVLVPISHLQSVRGSNGRWCYQSCPSFWCYRVVPGCLHASIAWTHGGQMPLVLDLDDTLVVANGERALREKKSRVRSSTPKPYFIRTPPSGLLGQQERCAHAGHNNAGITTAGGERGGESWAGVLGKAERSPVPR